MKILIAHDGSESAGRALTDLPYAGLPPKVEATVISIADMVCVPEATEVVDPALPDRLAESIRRAQSERLAAVERMRVHAVAAAEALREEFPGWAVVAEAFGDAPAWGIVKRADQLRPDLIVLGSHGHTALGRLTLGSTSLKVLNATTCSVRIARGGRKRGAAPRLLVGVDGSKHSLAAVRTVASRHWPPGTRVRVVSVLDASMSTALVVPHEDLRRWARETAGDEIWAHRMVTAVTDEIRGAGLEAEGEVVAGDPKVVLVEEAGRLEADGIFVGSQGLNAVERFLLGSVSSAVAVRAPCSVEVARARV
jgi:nucleotide-binding universal stress UspA family protein